MVFLNNVVFRSSDKLMCNRDMGAMQVFLNNQYEFLKRAGMISATLSLEYTSGAHNVTSSVTREGKDRPGRWGCSI